MGFRSQGLVVVALSSFLVGFGVCALMNKQQKKKAKRPPSSDALLTHCKVRTGKLEVGKLVDMVLSPKAGAVSTFSGTTRNNFEGKVVTQLEYECYVGMAEKKMVTIARDIRKKWPDVIHIAIEHKVGPCPILDTSVIIAVSSGHREAALDAVKYAINTLKATVPIWKKELYKGEEPKWKENKEFFEGRRVESK